jgi:uroporphyrinogen III methyltransferase/synthase
MSWRVAVTRDEPADGPLGAALRTAGLEAVYCQVMQELPPTHPSELEAVANELESYDWAIFASRRAVDAIARARHRFASWPVGLRTAAVGSSTAAALIAFGANPPPIVADESGAEALWAELHQRDWRGVRVLLPVVTGGRQTIIDGLRQNGATVTVVEAYRMAPRASNDIADDWRKAAPQAVVIASPSTARTLIDAVGRDALASLSAIVAIGPTTADAIRARGLTVDVSPATDFVATARFVRELHADG